MKIISKKVFKQVIIECPFSGRLKALNWVYENGYESTRSGPKPLKRGKTTYSLSTYQIVATKEISRSK